MKQIFKKRWLLLGIAVSTAALTSTDARSDLDLVDISRHALESDFSSCTDFTLKGTCFWLVCKPFCKVKPTPYIKHYSPDVVVSTYDSQGNSPFKGTNAITKVISLALGKGANGGEKSPKRKKGSKQDNSIIYRLADVYGSPAAWTLNSWLSNMYVACEPGSTILQPYFVSSSNPVFWYSGLVDSVVNFDEIIKGDKYLAERRDGDNPEYVLKTQPFWGHVYPRVGALQGQDHYRANAVIAARAIDSVIEGRYDIFNTQLDGKQGSYYLPSEQFETHTTEHGKFQMLYPIKESGCHILGDSTLRENTTLDGFSKRRSSNGDYAWHYWRKYICCNRPSGGKFLYKVTWQ
ncbi:TraU family protein [Pseudoalteromonas luteoviolacea]|uniref:TIGR03756 family integrating conjugative element protein n=1 Tax=Pseudoalteromonas luteoviolacea S4060-1 TaxID=1365257 RepID=A0A167KWD7_9GAMM|nr:TraU family protein [Pseudoalteromonas luteoviolacea]KZN63397.1 hypothetical protein N478_03850 [Pseudoalteromonas luteoviolacea S4060-1]